MNRPRRARGFILLLTLVLLALAAMALVGVCRANLRASVDATRAATDLQMRWGDLSCRSAFLPRAETILTAAEQAADRPLADTPVQLLLGDVRFDLVFTDEQAKPNLTNLADRRGAGDIERIARAAASAAGGRLRIHLRPTLRQATDPKRPGASARLYETFGQVFEGGEAPDLLAASRSFTCWGNGRLNWRRASASALAEIGAPLLSPRDVQALFAARHAGPEMTFANVLAGTGLDADRARALDAILADGSACHALWIAATPVRGSRGPRVSLTVDDAGGAGGRAIGFSW